MHLEANLRLVHPHGTVGIEGLPSQPLRIEISNRKVLQSLFKHLPSWRMAYRILQFFKTQSDNQPIELKVEQKVWLRLENGGMKARWWQLMRYWVLAKIR